jgi:hypothetical protein
VRGGSEAHNSGWMGLRSLPITLALGYCCAGNSQNGIHIEELSHTELDGPKCRSLFRNQGHDLTYPSSVVLDAVDRAGSFCRFDAAYLVRVSSFLN